LLDVALRLIEMRITGLPFSIEKPFVVRYPA
jgi:hypothetical protein